MTRFWIWLRFWVCQGSEHARLLNIPGFWICIHRYIQGICIQGTKYDRVTQDSEYVWIIPEYAYYAWICASIPKYAWIYLNLPEWFLFTLTYCNPLSKRMTVCFFWRDKIWFFYSCRKYFVCFRLVIFTRKISNLLLSLRAEEAGNGESCYTQQKYLMILYLMIYLSIFIAVIVFLLFSASYDLIKDSKRL